MIMLICMCMHLDVYRHIDLDFGESRLSTEVQAKAVYSSQLGSIRERLNVKEGYEVVAEAPAPPISTCTKWYQRKTRKHLQLELSHSFSGSQSVCGFEFPPVEMDPNHHEFQES